MSFLTSLHIPNLPGLLCPGCEQSQPKGRLCEVCISYLSVIHHGCRLCGEPDVMDLHCGLCLQHPPSWDQLSIPWHFEGLVRHLIHQFKYQQNTAAGASLCELWPTAKASESVEAIVPVPMHPRKLALKGDNHAHFLAKRFAKKLNKPIWQGVNRIEDTQPLEGLSKKERQAVLKGAFEVKKTPPKSVVIIDDVFTSGATAEAVTQELKKAGTQFVAVWALARTPLS